MEKVIKEIETSWKFKNRPFAVGTVYIFASFFIVFFNRLFKGYGDLFAFLMGVFLVIGILNIILGFLITSTIFKLYENHFIYQPNIIIKKKILYSSVENYTIQNQKIIIKYKVDTELSTQSIKLSKKKLNEKDFPFFDNLLKEKTSNYVSEQTQKT